MTASSVIQPSEAAQRYAGALFELAQDKGALSAVNKEFKAFGALVRASKDLRHLLDSPAIARDDKVAALSEISRKAGYSVLFAKFIAVMAANGRAGDMLAAEAAFDQIYARQRGVKRAVVRTARDMTPAEAARIEAVVSKLVGGEVDISREVDPALIGGIQLRLGSQLIDASLATKLKRMNTAMKGA